MFLLRCRWSWQIIFLSCDSSQPIGHLLSFTLNIQTHTHNTHRQTHNTKYTKALNLWSVCHFTQYFSSVYCMHNEYIVCSIEYIVYTSVLPSGKFLLGFHTQTDSRSSAGFQWWTDSHESLELETHSSLYLCTCVRMFFVCVRACSCVSLHAPVFACLCVFAYVIVCMHVCVCLFVCVCV